MARSTDHILTTHVGSLVRPPELMAYIEAMEHGTPLPDHDRYDRTIPLTPV